MRVKYPLYRDLSAVRALRARGAMPDAVWGSVIELMEAAWVGTRASRAVCVALNPEEGMLAEADREWLWRAYQVPVSAMLLGRNGAVLACECEAQTGLHIIRDGRPELLTGERTAEPCPCGRPGERLFLSAGDSHMLAGTAR
jgi:hypothetical protein